MDFKFINVGIADIEIASSPDILRTVLGSCVGICLYDKENKIGCLSHIMLPVINERATNKKKYADTAIPLMIEEMTSRGSDMSKVTAKIAGGATMFKISGNSMMGEIGKNNIKKVREVLDSLHIEITAEDVGGDYGRTIDFYTENGTLKIRSLGKEEKVL